MKALFNLAADLEAEFNTMNWRFCFIGGLALQRWGQPRLTMDVDVTLLTGFGGEAAYVDHLTSLYEGRVDNPREFALANRVLLLKSADGIGIDIALGGLPFEEEAVERASIYEFLPGLHLRTCSAEDLIVMKAFADRGQDWVDIEGVLVRQEGELDRDYVKKQLEPLCDLKGSPEIITRLEGLFRKGP